MSLNKKIGLGAVFGLGIFCVVSSAARLAYTAEYLALNPFKDQSPELNSAFPLPLPLPLPISLFPLPLPILPFPYPYTFLTHPPTDDEIGIIMWSGIEASASTICANLPSYGPLITKSRDLEYIVSAIRSRLSPHSHHQHHPHGKSSRGTQLSSSSEHIVDLVQVPATLTTIEGGVRDGRRGRKEELEMGRINVSTTVHI